MRPYVEKVECRRCGALNTAANRGCWDCGRVLDGRRYASEADFHKERQSVRTAGHAGSEGMRGGCHD